MKLAIAGTTGTVGKHVSAAAEKAGHEVVRMSRATGVDIVTGAGLAQALQGADAVIDVASAAAASTSAAVSFFGTSSATLLAAEKAAGVPHHIALSIVGIDGFRSGYYAGKVEQERVVMNGPVAWTILRATQFHEFASQLLGRASFGPFALMPVGRLQPVAASEVAASLVHLAESKQFGRAADLAGPREESLVEMARGYLRATGTRRAVIPLRAPGEMMRGLRDGSRLAGPGATLGTQTYAEWLQNLPRTS
ncbi:SDR family oxidoreductase [Parafrigoribacterium soli]|uniref:SDR family oxidoreductase n=1 Tax=Parafrigoribacterium soli TaxID=3144663 RepID=UPI0032ECE61A